MQTDLTVFNTHAEFKYFYNNNLLNYQEIDRVFQSSQAETSRKSSRKSTQAKKIEPRKKQSSRDELPSLAKPLVFTYTCMKF